MHPKFVPGLSLGGRQDHAHLWGCPRMLTEVVPETVRNDGGCRTYEAPGGDLLQVPGDVPAEVIRKGGSVNYDEQGPSPFPLAA